MNPPITIAHYRITAKLGEGGMGTVFRATDTRLNRDVAIKVLPPAFAEDLVRMARFEREAQVLASLNHPNIAAIYGIEAGAIIMELVEGANLTGPVAVETAIAYAKQIAAGLEAAHEKGIIHRDLKPANIRVTADGTVKILDFGLAKATGEHAVPSSSPTLAPTLSLTVTEPGTILGTAAYMSPEQARGMPVDKRADIWAFGVLLYELLTGRRLFGGGATVADTLASVVKDTPDFHALPRNTPAHVRRLLQLCVRKDVKLRLQAIGDARLALDEPEETSAVKTPTVFARRAWVPWAIAAFAILAGGTGWWPTSQPAKPRQMLRLNVEIDPDMPLASSNLGGIMALSLDGLRLVVALRGKDGRERLHTRLLDQGPLTLLAGTEGAGTPFFSPDGQWIGFAADGKLKKIPVEGGAVLTLCDASSIRGASWGDDGNIVFAPNANSGLLRVSSAGGTPSQLTVVNPGEGTHRWPQILPGSKVVLFTAGTAGNAYDNANIDAFSIQTGQRKTVHHGGFSGRYLATPNGSGRLIYLHEGTLFAAPFDLDRLAVAGGAVRVLEEVASSASRGGDFTFSPSGTLIYLAGKGQPVGWTISWVDSSGRRQPFEATPAGYRAPRISPDGKRLVFSVAAGQGRDLWVRNLDRDKPSRLSFLKGSNGDPVWTPDGKGIIFNSDDPGVPGMYWIRADGAGEPQRLTDGLLNQHPYSISPDGKRLAFSAPGGGNSRDLFTAPIEGDSVHPRLGKPDLFLGTPAAELHPAFSPDGRWMAYTSSESGSAELYVRPFPGPGGRWQISTGGGSFPVWSRDGRELLFQGPDNRVMAVSYVAKGDSFSAGKPNAWSETRVMTLAENLTWDLAPDGKRLIACLPLSDDKQKPSTHLNFLLNFSDELQRRAGERR